MSLTSAMNDPTMMQNLQGLLGNPLFNVGMGLLAARQDGSINPAQAALSGLMSSSSYTDKRKEKKRQEDFRKALAELLRGMAGQTVTTSAMGGNMPSLNYDVGAAAAQQQQLPLYKLFELNMG